MPFFPIPTELAVNGGPKTVRGEVISYPKGVIGKEEEDEVLAVLRSGKISGLGLGTKVEEFEDDFADWLGSRYAVATNGGTSAIGSALWAAGVGPGDEVILPAYTYVSSASAVLHVNGIPIYADVDPKTFNLDPDDVRKRITNKTKAIMPVHFMGQPAEMDEFVTLAKEHDVALIEDVAQSPGAKYHGKKVGSIGDLGCFSFQGGKCITTGEGGMVVTDDRELYERVLLAGSHPSKIMSVVRTDGAKWFEGIGPNWNFRMHPLAAAIGVAMLRKLDRYNALRIRNANFLTEALEGIEGIDPPYVDPGNKHVYWVYAMLYHEEQLGVPLSKFLTALSAEGVSYWGIGAACSLPLYKLPIYGKALEFYGKGCPYKCPHATLPTYEELPVTEQLCNSTFGIYGAIQPPNGRPLLNQYIRAIEKVVRNIEQIQ